MPKWKELKAEIVERFYQCLPFGYAYRAWYDRLKIMGCSLVRQTQVWKTPAVGKGRYNEGLEILLPGKPKCGTKSGKVFVLQDTPSGALECRETRKQGYAVIGRPIP